MGASGSKWVGSLSEIEGMKAGQYGSVWVRYPAGSTPNAAGSTVVASSAISGNFWCIEALTSIAFQTLTADGLSLVVSTTVASISDSTVIAGTRLYGKFTNIVVSSAVVPCAFIAYNALVSS